MYIPTPSPPASPEVQYLSEKIAETVREFRDAHPGLGDDDVATAFTIARNRFATGGADDPRRLAAGVLLTVGLFVAAAGLLFFAKGGGEMSWPVLLPVIGIVLGFVIVLAKKSNEGPDRARILMVMLVTGLLLAGLLAFFLFARGSGLPLG